VPLHAHSPLAAVLVLDTQGGQRLAEVLLLGAALVVGAVLVRAAVTGLAAFGQTELIGWAVLVSLAAPGGVGLVSGVGGVAVLARVPLGRPGGGDADAVATLLPRRTVLVGVALVAVFAGLGLVRLRTGRHRQRHEQGAAEGPGKGMTAGAHALLQGTQGPDPLAEVGQCAT